MGVRIIGSFEEFVLLAVQKLVNELQPTSALNIKDELEMALHRRVLAATVYTTARRLNKRKLLRTAELPSRNMRGGRSRIAYELTYSGLQILEDLHQTRKHLISEKQTAA